MGFNTRTVVKDIGLYLTKIKSIIGLFIKLDIFSETAQSFLDSEKVKVSSGPWDPHPQSIQ